MRGRPAAADGPRPKLPDAAVDAVASSGRAVPADGRHSHAEAIERMRIARRRRIVVVHVNITPEAMRNRVFDAVLVKHQH